MRNNLTSLEWIKLKPKEGDEHHWYSSQAGWTFDLYEINGSYKLNVSILESTEFIGWYSSLDSAKYQAKNSHDSAMRKIMELFT